MTLHITCDSYFSVGQSDRNCSEVAEGAMALADNA